VRRWLGSTLTAKAISVFVLPLTACTSGLSEEPPTVWRQDTDVLNCTPAAFGDSEFLLVTLGPGHGAELAILRHSDDAPYFLVVQSPPADMRILMTREEFAEATTVRLSTATSGYRWVKDGENERIFTTPGRYTIQVSELLESELGGHTCTVEYRALSAGVSARRASTPTRRR